MVCRELKILKILIEKGSKFDHIISVTLIPSDFRKISIEEGVDWYNSDKKYYTEYCPIHAIVYQWGVDLVEYCIKCGLNLNILDSQGNTLMHYAAYRSENFSKYQIAAMINQYALNHLPNYQNSIENILKKLDYVDTSSIINSYGSKFGIFDQNASMLKFLYKKKLSIKAKNIDGFQPIHYAVMKNFEAVKFLIEKRADLGAIGNDRRIPLHHAIAHGTPEIVNLLLSKKLNYDIQDFKLDYPINMIVNQKYSGIIIGILQVLVKYGVSLDSPSFSDGGPILFDYLKNYNVLKFLIDNGADLNKKDLKQDTALSHCLSQNNYIGAKMLLDGGANVNESNHDTKSNLFECFNPKFMKLVLEYHPILFFDAPKFYILNRRLDVAKELIRYYPKEDHYLIYNAAISLCSYDMVKYLIDHNFDFDSRSIDGMTPIFDAIRFNQIDILKLLINSGANLENTDINGETAILYATSFLSRGKFGNNHLNMPNINNMNDLIKFLIDCDANINTENKSHNNLLQNSIVNGNILLYNKLKYLGIKTQLINNESLDSLRKKIKVTGETLFTYIVKNDNIIFLELYNSIIVEEKKIPDINVQNVSGETPIMCVIKYNKNPAYLTLLIRGGADADQEYQGKTPLQICIENEYTDKIRAFLQNECCDLNKKFDNEMSYFHLAIKMNKKLSMRALASYVFPDFVDKDGNSYLHYAALSNDHEITYICLHVQEKYIVYNNENMSPLMLASSINSFRYIDQFIDFCDKHWIPIKDKYRSLVLSVMNRSFDSYYSILKIILCSVDPNSENTK